MRYSPKLNRLCRSRGLRFVLAAARRLRKSQSTISTAIANLEADLGVRCLTGRRASRR
jgi:DNA-binding transcriptional LysR family regulator